MSPAPASPATSAVTGAGLIESLEQLMHGVQSRDWVDVALGGVATSLDAFAVTIDPLGTVAAWGFSWLIEHLKPLKAALDSLAGEPGQIHGNVQTWQNIARVVRNDREQVSQEVRRIAQNWTGTGGTAARQHTDQHRQILDNLALAAEVIAAIVGGGALLVALVRGLVRDLIAQLLATIAVRIPSWIAAEAGSLGTATPAIVSQGLALIGQCGKKISALLSALKSSMQRLGHHIADLGHLIDQMRHRIAKVDHHIADASLVPVHPPRSGRAPMPVKEMNPNYAGEHLPGNHVLFGNQVHYLSERELAQHRLVAHDGKLYDTTGKLFDSGATGDRGAIYVMDDQGNLYASNYQAIGQFHHSSFLAGEPVAGAGHIVVKNGEVVKMNNTSGHYKPDRDFAVRVRAELVRQGVKFRPGALTYFSF